MQRRLTTIMVVDVVGYSRLMEGAEESTAARLKECQALISRTVDAGGGRVFNLSGDAILAEFESPINAVRSAAAIRDEMAARDAESEDRLRLRFGLHLADVIVSGDDLLGDGVNVAARIQQSAQADTICVSQTLFDQIKRHSSFSFEDQGEQHFKNLAEPIRTYRLRGHARGSADPTGPQVGLSPAPRDKDQPSIVVMPFDNLSGEGDEYFVDGVVEEITSALSRVRDFFVIARQSAFRYKGRFVDVREVGRELGVRYVVEGTVRRGGERLRISVQLVDAETRTQLWSGRCEGATTDIFEFQDQIAAQVAGAIHPAIRNAEIEMVKRKPPSSLKAYDLVMRAYPHIWSHNREKNRQAISLLREAIASDPNYGRAHALLAWCHSQEVVYLWSFEPAKDRDCAIRAVEAASDGIQDDPTALAAAGAALTQCGDYHRAGTYIESALALDRNNAWAWARYAWLAFVRGDPDSAKERFERALGLSPLDPLEFNLRIGIAFVWALKGEYAVAARMTREVLDKHPGITWAYRQLASFSALAGDLPTARDAMGKFLADNPKVTIEVMKTNHPMRHLGKFFDKLLEGWRLAGLPEK